MHGKGSFFKAATGGIRKGEKVMVSGWIEVFSMARSFYFS